MAGLSVTRDQAIAYRLDAQHLAERLPVTELLTAAGAGGVQDTPPGSAALSLRARLEGLTPEALQKALAEEKSLLQTMSLRGAAYIFPTADAAVFTTGALPESEAEMRFFIQGAAASLDALNMRYSELVERAGRAMREVLHGTQMTKDPLGRAVAERIAAELPAGQAEGWKKPSTIIPGQFLGESLSRFAIYVLGLRGLFCFAPRGSSAAEFLLTEQWLGNAPPASDPDNARRELARRYIRCCGPSTASDFAEWAGISPAQAARGWALIEPRLLPVNFEGRAAFLHEEDLARFQSPRPAAGIRLLPPHDPYLLLRDRATLVPDRKLQQGLWRAVGNPGVLLVDGDLRGMWRARKQGKRLEVTIQPLAPLAKTVEAAIEAEAARLLPFKECAAVSVRFGDAETLPS